MKIKVLEYEKVGVGAVKGKCSVFVEDIGMKMVDIRIIDSKSGGYFYSLPSQTFKNQQGETKYRQLVFFDDRDAFKNDMDIAFKEYFANNKAEEPQAPKPKARPAEILCNTPDDEEVPF